VKPSREQAKYLGLGFGNAGSNKPNLRTLITPSTKSVAKSTYGRRKKLLNKPWIIYYYAIGTRKKKIRKLDGGASLG